MITSMIAQQKRALLASDLPDRSLIILVGKREQIRNGDVTYPFRQDSDLLLLTGADIPDLILVGIKDEGEIHWILYSDHLDEKEILW